MIRPRREITVYSALVINEQEDILLVKRYEPELPEVHGLWELPAGKKDAEETPEETVQRETWEETGYQISAYQQLPESYLCEWQYQDFDQQTVIICYLAELVSPKQELTNDHHVSDIRWVKRKNIGKYSLLPGVLFFIEQAFSTVDR